MARQLDQSLKSDFVLLFLQRLFHGLHKHLYSEIVGRLKFRQPPAPRLDFSAQRDFQQCERLAREGESDAGKLAEALHLARQIWQRDIDNLSMRAWVAYLEAKSTISAAENRLLQIKNRRDPKLGFTTDWNLAVLAHERKEEQAAYQLLAPLLDHNDADEDLFLVLLALSLKLNDLARFLQVIPRTLSLKFHPVAICVALEVKDEPRAKDLLRELLTQWESGYKLPPADTRFEWGEFDNTISTAISVGQIDQLVAWLEARVKLQAYYMPNYLKLAKVLEEEKCDVRGAYEILRRRLEWARGKADRKGFDDACRDILELCKRHDNAELGQQAYRLAQQPPRACDDLLGAFNAYSPPRRFAAGAARSAPARTKDARADQRPQAHRTTAVGQCPARRDSERGLLRKRECVHRGTGLASGNAGSQHQ